MADAKTTALTELTTVASGDWLYIVDVSDTTDGATGTGKKIKQSNVVLGLGDVSSNTATSVDNELALFSSTAGKTIKRASTTGIAKLTSGVLSVVTAPTGTIVGTSDSQTLTTKTLTTPTITKPVMNATNPTAQTYSPAGAGTATLDLSLSNSHFITMPAGNITIALSNDTNNQFFYVSILQDATGSRTVTWFSTIRWYPNGTVPTLTTTASKRDAFGFVRTGSGTYDGFVIGQGG